MTRPSLVGLLMWVVLLGALPVLAGGSGGHGGGGHCGGANGGGGGHGSANHGGSSHGVIGHGGVSHGTSTCGRPGGFGAGLGNSGWNYLDRIGPTPRYGDSDSGGAAAGDPGDGSHSPPSAGDEGAQYRYDHRSNGD
jgi:hypothetical protein